MSKITKTTDQKAVRGRPKDPEKAKKIFRAASRLFMTKGLQGTSMDAVAKEADVSKQTLYSHFSGKEDLYRAVIECKLDSYNLSSDDVPVSNNLEEDLYRIGLKILRLEMDSDAIAMLRSVVGEGYSHRKTSQLYYENGPEKVVAEITHYLESQNIEDAKFYAVAFLNMLEGEWLMNTLMGLQEPPSDDQMKIHVEKVCACFIKML